MAQHKTANAAELEVHTEVEKVDIGIPANDRQSPRPDLNGLRVKLPNRPEIYLIDEGYKRHIPNPQTYNNLFRDWSGIVVDIDIDEIPTGVPITSGAILTRGAGTAEVYLVANNKKRHVFNMDKYWFSWQRVYIVPRILLNCIPDGTNIL